MSHFAFLQAEWPDVFDAADHAAALAHADPRTACFYCRRALELAVAWVYRADAALRLPYQDNISALIHEPTFKALVGDKLVAKARVVKELGNSAAHERRAIPFQRAATALREESFSRLAIGVASAVVSDGHIDRIFTLGLRGTSSERFAICALSGCSLLWLLSGYSLIFFSAFLLRYCL